MWTVGDRSASETLTPSDHLYYSHINELRKALGQVFHATAYGAVADGVTDDSTAINDAISAASAAGRGTVELPAGTIYCGSTIAPVSNVWIRGQGIDKTILKPNPSKTGANGDVIRRVIGTSSTYAEYIGVFDLTIDCTDQYSSSPLGTNVTPYSNGITLQGCNYTLIERVRIKNPFGFGIVIGSNGGGTPRIKYPQLRNIYIEGERNGNDS
jgi:Pectate lyase superfamily protein